MHTNTVACPSCAFCNAVTDSASASPRCARCRCWLPWIVAADDRDFAGIVKNCPVPVLVDMRVRDSSTRGPANSAPIQLAIERAGALKLVELEVDPGHMLAQRFDDGSGPRLLVMNGGTVLAQHCGASSIATLRRWLDDAV